MKITINEPAPEKPVKKQLTYPCVREWTGSKNMGHENVIVLFTSETQGVPLRHYTSNKGLREWVKATNKDWKEFEGKITIECP